ncbi:hypothetical protein FJT64_017906 [Amphibalanus amphitrite]|uniref:Uncharacterized protein n=1 Tax=Amphibalanus amphitrite TaxID=1232801 RepID=A0A6A4XA51_AMPAM|nr:hypothetical protein FJT64_017906 [Amphibalanus amphitrite]
MSDAENDSNRAEELHELREQLATALQRITEQQQSIRDLSRRLELSLTSAAAAPGTAGVPVPESADNRGTPAPAVLSGAAADGLTGQILDVFVACGDVFNPYQTVKRRMLDWMKRQELSGNCSARDRFRSCRRNQVDLNLHGVHLELTDCLVLSDAESPTDVIVGRDTLERLGLNAVTLKTFFCLTAESESQTSPLSENTNTRIVFFMSSLAMFGRS